MFLWLSNFLSDQFRQKFPDLVGYSSKSFWQDLAAGLTVGIVALPLSLALAIATGVPPIFGLYTAGIAGIIAALTSGSPYSVSGPAAAMVPILALIIQKHGLAELPYITIMAGVLLAFFALLGIGKYIRKVPESVVLGFTAGVAAVLFFGQINSFLGLSNIASHEHFANKFMETFTHLPTMHLPTVIVGVLALIIIIYSSRIRQIAKIPSTLLAVIFMTLLVVFVPYFQGVATLGSTYGALPLGFPDFNSSLSADHFANGSLWVAALQIAVLISIESLLCAVVADRLTKTRHRPNQELAAQGFANLGSALFGGLPATAVIARTGTNIKSGAVSRLSSVIHAVVVLVFVVALAPLAAKIPLTVLSAVLLVTAVKISEVKEIRHFIRSKGMLLVSVLAVTLVLTIFTDLVKGVGAGILLHLAFSAHGKLRDRRNKDGQLRLSEEEAI
jgi:SulP family sulfate permease